MSPEDGAERRGLLQRFALKDGDTFLLADALGHIQDSQDGLFSSDTRVLSHLELEIGRRHPSLLGGAVALDNVLFTSQLTNRPLPAPGDRAIPRGVIHIERSCFLCAGCLQDRWRFTNFSGQVALLPVTVHFGADFADIFEVRGAHRARRGEYLAPELGASSVRLSYRGLDARVRTTELRFAPTPAHLSASEATFSLPLAVGAATEIYVEIAQAPSDQPPSKKRFDAELVRARKSMSARLSQGASIACSGRLFEAWIEQSRSDLALLTTTLDSGPYPYAGIPWFATQFGRDAIVTALQTLWLDPQLTAGVLRFLAATQAQSESSFEDSEPGKIVHEIRRGEMATLNEVPFRHYYGGVDTTPLFVMLAGAYEERTGDESLVDAIWQNLRAAIGWVERRLDRSPTGFLDYARGQSSGLANQGWKDSHDSIFHADGRIPDGPIAVIEVQGYACAALMCMARLAARRGHHDASTAWRTRATRLAAQIEQRFWIERLSFYALALDGDDQPCAVRSSNAGHLLYCEVAAAERADAVAHQLLDASFCNGWGIRTIHPEEARYNPMSYHNGAVWPHDTALCAAGIARYLGASAIVPLLSGVFEAASHFGMRMPELFCGFERIAGQPPTPYPVACQPQAWASGSVFMLLQACLGIRVDGRRREIHLERPQLPIGIESLVLRDLKIGSGTIDVQLRRFGDSTLVASSHSPHDGIRVLTHT